MVKQGLQLHCRLPVLTTVPPSGPVRAPRHRRLLNQIRMGKKRGSHNRLPALTLGLGLPKSWWARTIQTTTYPSTLDFDVAPRLTHCIKPIPPRPPSEYLVYIVIGCCSVIYLARDRVIYAWRNIVHAFSSLTCVTSDDTQ